ncbi:uridine kinase [bacterium]|nr:uridine kinase [bacterium]
MPWRASTSSRTPSSRASTRTTPTGTGGSTLPPDHRNSTRTACGSDCRRVSRRRPAPARRRAAAARLVRLSSRPRLASGGPLTRDSLLAELAHAIAATARSYPIRVAIDGVGASGKTVLADELAGSLAGLGRTVIRASIDGFHRPRHQRYERGNTSPEGYLDDSFDYDAVRSRLLIPLGPGGSLRYRTAVFDFRTESAVDSQTRTADPDAVLLFDGVFILREELRGSWDFSIFVDAGFEVTLARALERDLSLFGSERAVRERYESRYIPGERLYLERCRPREYADAVVFNDEPANPGLEWKRTSRGQR